MNCLNTVYYQFAPKNKGIRSNELSSKTNRPCNIKFVKLDDYCILYISWFLYDETNIFVFNDVPHLIKLLRYHFIDSGFIINNKEVKKDIILNLLTLQPNDLNITHKISAHNLKVIGV